MRKFIHSNFELDLSNLKITDTAENPWFTGNYFAKYSYPFNLPFSKENDLMFGFISQYNSANTETLFEGYYCHGDTLEKAVLEIEECENELSATLRYGLEEFPSFSKKLAELPLLQLEVEDIYEHAADVVEQTWPNVKYNFPQIHIDKIETEDSEVWFAFNKIINNYSSGSFLVNDVDLEEEITYNRNIVQPLPYLLYLVQAIVEAAGYTLHGDILDDTDYKKTCIYADVEYYRSIAQESIPVLVSAVEYEDELITVPGVNHDYSAINVSRTVTIGQKGKYRIIGKAKFRFLGYEYINLRIKYRDIVLAEYNYFGFEVSVATTWNIDIVFETIDDLNPDELYFTAYVGYNEFDVTFDLNVNPIILHNEEGEVVPSIINENRVDLTRAVPDMLAGDFMKLILGMKRYDLSTRGSQVWINFIDNEIRSKPVIDLSGLEVKFPKRTFSKGNSWLMRYQDVNSEEYSFVSIFQDSTGFTSTDYTKNDKTTEIEFNALPLPLLLRNDVQTAHGFLEDKAKPFFVIYNGLQGGKNLSRDASRLLIPKLHDSYHKDWFAANISSQAFTWRFLDWYENVAVLNAKSRVFAYGNIHLVRQIQKAETSPDLFDVEIETVVL